ncbi:NAD(P)H-dependent oxidoreductase subunit E [Candidatus Aminicenantes bacterium AC-335-O07]|nr:NAD(P)H-dependent oxidoreductase subunit E [Candidatus Aminicenantes bacterium AC-335-O07]
MKKINNINQFYDLKKKIEGLKSNQYPIIAISSGTCGLARGSDKIIKTFLEELKNRKLDDKVELKITGCHGFCEAEPNIVIFPQEIFYQKLEPKDVKEVISETILGGRIIERLLYFDPHSNQKFTYKKEIPFYQKQKRLLLENNLFIDPNKIEDYIAVGGYTALSKVLTELSPEQVIEIIKKSGLRGRGGAGFPTGKKWEITKKAKIKEKYIICNADEGDPGAYMDRSLLEGNPHSVIEGMIIGAYAIGASKGYIYVRDEYPLAVKNVTRAIQQARE